MQLAATRLNINCRQNHSAIRSLEPSVERLCRNEKIRFMERYGVYGPSHPFSKFVRSLVPNTSENDIKIFVTKGWEEINAAAFPDGTIFLSDRIISFCEFKEELEFLLQHEITHIRNGHAEKRLRERDAIGMLGSARLSEYEADLEHMIASREEGVNPHGGIVFLRRIAQEEEKEQKGHDIVHGNTYTRLINVEFAARIIDMDALSAELTPIPHVLRTSDLNGSDAWSALSRIQPGDFETANTLISSLGFHGMISNAKTIFKLANSLPEDERKTLLGHTRMRIEKQVESAWPGASPESVCAMRMLLVANSLSGSDEMAKEMRKQLTYLAESPAFPIELQAMFGQIQARLAVFLSVEIAKEVLGALIRRNSNESNDSSPKDAYLAAKRLRSALMEAFHEGSRSFGEERLANLLIRTYSPEGSVQERSERLVQYMKAVEQDGLGMDEFRLFENAFRYFSLPEEAHNDLLKHIMLGKIQDRDFELMKKVALISQMKPLVPDASLVNENDLNEQHKGLVSEEKHKAKLSAEQIWDQANAMLDAIAPKSLEDFICFLNAWKQAQPKQASKFDISRIEAFSYLVEKYPYEFHLSLINRLKCGNLSNSEIITLAKSAIDAKLYEYPVTVLLLGKNRIFSRDELKELNSMIGEYARILCMRNLRAAKNRKEFFDFLLFVQREAIRCKHTEIDSFAMYDANVSFTDIALHVFQAYGFDMKKKEELDQLLTASCFVKDPNARLRLQKAVLARYVPLLGKDEARKLLFNDRRVADYVAINAREDFIDSEVSEPKELESIKEEIVSRARSLESGAAGAIVLKEGIVSLLLKDKERLFQALLLSSRSNGMLRSFMAEVLLAAYLIYKLESTDFSLFCDQYFEQGTDEALVEGIDAASVLYGPSFKEYEDMLYRLDYESRHVLANELLVGNGGVLLTREKRERVLSWFFGNFVQKPVEEHEKKVYEFLELAFRNIAASADISTLYFLMHPIVVERMLGKPKKNATWKVALMNAKTIVLAKACKQAEDEYYFGEELNVVCEELVKVANKGFGHKDEKGECHEVPNADKTAALNSMIMRYLADAPKTVDKLSPVEFVKQLSSQMGAPGVRFLQSLGIYADIPPELRKEFDDVYDNVRGQYKLSAFHTLTRGKRADGVFRGLETLGRRIGGGSLVTVYESTVNGRHCVVKVVNPNVEYRAGQVCDNLEAIFSSDERLKRGVPLIESIRTWVRKDVSFDAAKYETEFRKQNDGFCVKGNPFKIRVPAVMERSAKYVVEEYAQGLNLTKWDEIAARHDIKQVISLVVKNAAHQLSNGLVHADIHVGNIRVDEEKNIHLLDKNFLLVLSGQDKVFIGSLAFLASDKPALAKAVGDYLCGFEENKKVDNETLVSRLTEILVANGHRDVGSFVSDCVAVVTEHKGSIPLNVMLLVKNALALERMAMRAGFGNLIDAFLFDAQKP